MRNSMLVGLLVLLTTGIASATLVDDCDDFVAAGPTDWWMSQDWIGASVLSTDKVQGSYSHKYGPITNEGMANLDIGFQNWTGMTEFSYYAKYTGTTTGNGQLHFIAYTDSWATVVDSWDSLSNDWQKITISLVGATLTEVRYLRFQTYGSNLGGADNTYLDNLEVIPEPATMVLLGLGSVGLLIRRRQPALVG